jgi:hypothetical protein
MFENIDQVELEEMGFLGAIACSANGSIIDATSDELEVFGGILGYITQVADMIGEPFGLDSAEEIQLESANTKAICVPQEEGAAMGLLCSGRANADAILSEIID